MSYVHDRLVWKLAIAPTNKLVLLALCHFADQEGHCYPSVATVARMAGITKRHCQRLMGQLVEESFVVVTGNAQGGMRTRDYLVSLPALRRGAAGVASENRSPAAPVTPLRAASARKSHDPRVTRTTSLNRKSETPPPSAEDVASLDWSGLPQFREAEKVVVVDLLKGLSPEYLQDLVDELGGALRANAIRGQWPAWLRAVARRAQDGGFVANHALAVQQGRQRVAREAVEAEKRRAQAARRVDPSTHAKNLAAMSAVIAELGTPMRVSARASTSKPA